ncbi:RsmB/NOP family class I SAM-dependent RNA methyltransferase, partial [Clostridium saudiense]|nr:RsmB/NOP family class I SAM-dependent RNA methyltransferase [Clostridium saudiense]
MQNLSSMIPAEILDANEKDKVLDMCAAPGGKTLKLAEKMNNEGLIIANEVNRIRYERLKFNLEKLGAKNVTALNLDGRKLVHIYKEYFDKILLDVPCSGEGTINIKNTKKLKLLKNTPFVKVQKELIQSAFITLKKGGVMLYSTCT